MQIRIPKAAILLILAQVTAVAGATEVYQWVDEDGVVHFSDTKPEQTEVVTTLQVSEANPPGYDPAEDPYSIRNQAERMGETRARLEKEREARKEERRKDENYRPRYAQPPYSPYRFYSRPFYFPQTIPNRVPTRPGRTSGRQVVALDELGLTGQRPHSINSGAHQARVARSARAIEGTSSAPPRINPYRR